MQVLKEELKKFENITVLEVGCGNWSFAKDILESQGCTWYGLDVIPTKIANLKGTVNNIPLMDGTIDLVLCNQTMEHWFEYGVSFKQAYSEINRVLKDEGIFLSNVPIHLHGHPWFVKGKTEKVREGLQNFFCNIQMSYYYADEEDEGWKKVADRGFFSKFGYPNWWVPKGCFTHQLFISCVKCDVKKCVLTPKYNDRLRIPKMLFRFVKEWLK